MTESYCEPETGSKPIEIAVVTPVHNRREITLAFLQSVAELDTQGLSVSIYVVDDGSTDGTTEAILSRFPAVQVLSGDGSLWYSEGTNVGLRAALRDNPDYILMANNDSVFEPDLLMRLVATAKANERSVVGALLLRWDRRDAVFQVSPMWSVACGGWRHWFEQTIATVPDRPWTVDLIVGNCLLVPAQAFHDHGLLDSRRYPQFADAEFTPRLRRAGWTLIIEPSARVYCKPNDVPPRIRRLGFVGAFDAMVRDRHHPHHIMRRVRSLLDGGPTRLHGMAAIAVFLLRVIIGRNLESARGRRGRPEPPLAQTFAHRVIDRASA